MIKLIKWGEFTKFVNNLKDGLLTVGKAKVANTAQDVAAGSTLETIVKNLATTEALTAETTRATGVETGLRTDVDHVYNDIVVADTTGTDVKKTELSKALQIDLGTEEEPDVQTIATIQIDKATASKAGLMSASDKAKLDSNDAIATAALAGNVLNPDNLIVPITTAGTATGWTCNNSTSDKVQTDGNGMYYCKNSSSEGSNDLWTPYISVVAGSSYFISLGGYPNFNIQIVNESGTTLLTADSQEEYAFTPTTSEKVKINFYNIAGGKSDPYGNYAVYQPLMILNTAAPGYYNTVSSVNYLVTSTHNGLMSASDKSSLNSLKSEPARAKNVEAGLRTDVDNLTNTVDTTTVANIKYDTTNNYLVITDANGTEHNFAPATTA